MHWRYIQLKYQLYLTDIFGSIIVLVFMILRYKQKKVTAILKNTTLGGLKI